MLTAPSLAKDQELWAMYALVGEKRAQVVPLTAGLKPLAIELPVRRDEHLQQFIDSIPHLRTIICFDKKSPQERILVEAVYNLPAVQKVIQENKELFDSLGFSADKAEEVVEKLVTKYETSFHGRKKENQHYWDLQQAFGLLLGYDAQSCRDYRFHVFDWSKIFMPLDHAGAHPMNANPFNFYGVDYWISDPENNTDFKTLKAGYEELVNKIERHLEKGLSPLETLAILNEEYEGLRIATARDVSKTLITFF